MTDEQIIKALEICTDEHMGCEDGCPYATKKLTYSQCKLELSKNIIDLINRQKAEIFNLNKEISALKLKNDEFLNSNEKAKAEVERLKEENEKQKIILEEINNEINPLPFVTDFDVAMSQAKSEAYREFVMNVLRRIGFCELPNAVVRGHINKAYEELTRNLHGTCTETTDQTATNHSVSLIDGHIEE